LPGEEFADVENEIAMLEECNHENIVAYYGSFIKNNTMWICMEFCGGGSVSDMYNCELMTETAPAACCSFFPHKCQHRSASMKNDVKYDAQVLFCFPHFFPR
jgi:serine/threonine protein kinase